VVTSYNRPALMNHTSISHLDPPVTQTVVTLLSFIYVGLTLAADLTNAWLDPRIRVG
jgi:ABC-type dipeptide/oligopeptide/nickel transport system permease component